MPHTIYKQATWNCSSIANIQDCLSLANFVLHLNYSCNFAKVLSLYPKIFIYVVINVLWLRSLRYNSDYFLCNYYPPIGCKAYHPLQLYLPANNSLFISNLPPFALSNSSPFKSTSIHLSHPAIHIFIKKLCRHHTALSQSNINRKPFTDIHSYPDTRPTIYIRTRHCFQQFSSNLIHS